MRGPSGSESRSPLILCAGTAAFPCRGQEANTARLEAEAIGQAAEADRLFKKGEFAAALPLYAAERATRAALADRRYEAYAVRAIGCCYVELGDIDAALDAWHVAIELDAKREDRGFEGYDWLLIGNVELSRERFEAAEKALRRALPLLSQAIDRDHECDARRLLARVLTSLDRAAEAGPHVARAWDLARDLNAPKLLALVTAEAGRTALALGDSGPAAEWLGDARIAFHDQGREAEAALMDRLLGEAFLDLDRPDVAVARVEDAARVDERLQDAESLADDCRFLAARKAESGDPAAACALARRALATEREAGDAEGEREALVLLAHFQSLGGKWTDAAATLSEALTLARRDAEPAELVPLLILAADVEHRAGRKSRSAVLLDEAQRAATTAVLSRSVAEARAAPCDRPLGGVAGAEGRAAADAPERAGATPHNMASSRQFTLQSVGIRCY